MSFALQLFGAIGVPAIISGLVMLSINRYLKRKDDKDEARAAAAREESVIIIKSIQAVGHLAEATAVGHQKNLFNGNIDEALDYYHKARDGTNDFLLRQNAAANH
jgi:hypothetical protein